LGAESGSAKEYDEATKTLFHGFHVGLIEGEAEARARRK
jgi:hypothetical protein